MSFDVQNIKEGSGQTDAPWYIRDATILGHEGVFDINVENGKFKSLVATDNKANCLLLPVLVDCHVHLDKTYTIERCQGEVRSLMDAIVLMEKDKVNWDYNDIYLRAERALSAAYQNGICAMRSHVDWEDATPPIAWQVLQDLKIKWQGKIELQLAALLSLDVFENDADTIASFIAKTKDVIGAFVNRNENLELKLTRLFEAAIAHDLSLDFHVDESLDINANDFDCIVKLAEKYNYGRRVLCGHCCALSQRDENEVSELLKRASNAGIALTILPTTNAWLQDQNEARTPRFRGIAPIKEARTNNMQVLIGLDNCQDGFFPYGNYDLLDAYRSAVFAGQLSPKAYFDCISTTPAQQLGLKNYHGIAQGASADGILIKAISIDDWVSRPNASRMVIRDGKTINQLN